MPFTSLGLAPALQKAAAAAGFSNPTPIQGEAIPAILAGNDVLGIARTGSGKTAGYVLPIVHHLRSIEAPRHREPVVLVLVPTRELAHQVSKVFESFLPAITPRLSCLAITGGSSVNTQMRTIGRAAIVVATPGRLLELIGKNAVKLSSITTLVLDEADKMLHLGFKDEVDRILALLPANRQNLLFSATLSEPVKHIRQLLLRDPHVIEIPEDETADTIHQIAYLVPEIKKGPLLRYLIKHGNLSQVLVFASSTAQVDRVVNKLIKNKIEAGAMHSKLSPQTRLHHLEQFKAGEMRVLVSTDLLARGIDIDFLPCVINYELPRSPKDYVHRIGRTGRADHPGDAISLVSPEEMDHFKLIQKKTGKRVTLLHGDAIDVRGC
ncbi:DEAD/DEAH box helicase [Luteolibacter yonseiensis]|uniref:DEAD/DEAH box helicase n=1 Tax=Luteolibacter yonseiensis TaxID=1144680 RepID=A0A934R3D1_9BACT|nr:DEAD/DEAH box helicase [Luteolibacter yonseiensis]MBK1816087.1 DEAD/DEAH box helicase [Luteolibacter yonseiensis]